MQVRYEELPEASRQELADALERGDDQATRLALLCVVQSDPDWRWCQSTCLELLLHDAWEVRAAAATSLGHVARLHGQLDLEIVLPALREALKDEKIAGYARDAMDDLEVFVPE